MPEQEQESKETRFSEDLAGPGLQLDLTSSPWNLKPGYCQHIIGRDVIHPGILAPDGGRKPLAVVCPSASEVTSVIEVNYSGRVVCRWQEFYNTDFFTLVTVAGPPAQQGIKQKAPYTVRFSADMVGAYLCVSPCNASGGTPADRYQVEYRQIVSCSTVTRANDTIMWQPAVSFTLAHNYHKLWVVYSKTVDRNGILISDGRKFWLVQDATYYQVMDLGSDSYLGTRWRGTMIETNRVLLTTAKYPPRIFLLSNSLPDASTATDDSYAGISTPVKTPVREPEFIASPVGGNNPSFAIETVGAAGRLSAGSYRVKVRAVNIEDGSHSRLVQAFNSSTRIDDTVTAVPNDGIKVFTWHRDDKVMTPPDGRKWTHLEIWRTVANGTSYYLEGMIPYVKTSDNPTWENEWSESGAAPLDYGLNSVLSYDVNFYACECVCSDAELVTRQQLTATDLASGYRPPLCQEAVNLQGVTLCFGKASSDALPNITLYSRQYFMYSAGTSYTHLTRRLAFSGGANLWTDLTEYGVDEELVITGSTEGVTGTYQISAKTAANILTLVAPGPGQDLTNVVGYIRRPYAIPSPKIVNDEEVWYSRTDMFAPETFLQRTLILSRTGDVFRAARAVNNYVAVIMAGGVHLLYLSTDTSGNITLQSNQVSATGDGTPWSDSVVVWGNNVVWANSRGPWVLVTSPDADINGFRGQIKPLDENGTMRAWFEYAYEMGWTVDAGVDTHNGCIRFRRRGADDNLTEALQYSYRTGLWTEILDDSGFRYVRSAYADDTEVADGLLYSVNKDGTLLEVNYYGTSHPYLLPGVCSQITIDITYTVTTTSLTKNGAFSAAMRGDVIRFRSSNTNVDGVRRVIRTATANAITFDAVTGLARYTDEFMIGVSPFRLRFWPLFGASHENIKTLRDIYLTAFPGRRSSAAVYALPPPGKFTVRGYDEYSDDPQDEQLQEISIFGNEAGSVARVSGDRTSALELQGTSPQIEIELMETQTDFYMEHLKVEMRETSSRMADASTT